jgi:DNA-directed RNA polymerase specialized sigma24 family protein
VTAAHPTRQTPDLASLYAALSTRLEGAVRHALRGHDRCAGRDVVIEDACQFAWTQLLGQSPDVHREAVLSWLSRTAAREAFKLTRRERSEVPLGLAGGGALPDTGADVTELIEARDRIQRVGTLGRRHQRFLWLKAIGLDYEEMAAYEGCTRRTVERQLLRARDRARRL